MRILVIDNTIERKCWGSPELARLGRLFPGATVLTRRAPERDLPASPLGFDRVIVSGSMTAATDDAPWISDLLDFTLRTLDAGRPFLGICYGHQILARALGGKEVVRRAAEAEFGWVQVEQVGPAEDSSSLFKGLPSKFYSFGSHFDEVCQLPSGLKLLARSQLCGVQACQLERKPVFGVQFHPEKILGEAERTLVERKQKGTPSKLLHADRGSELYDARVGESIFRNFLNS